MAFAVRGAANTNQSLLTVDRIFTSGEFNGEGYASWQWRRFGHGGTLWERAEGGRPGSDLVFLEPESGRKEVVVPSHLLIPPGQSSPLTVEHYSFSEDESKVLIFTQGKRVWRAATRGDYWVLDIAGREMKKLGGQAPPSSLMFATFSPDGRRVAYVLGNNLCVEDLRSGRITAVTTNGSDTIINGTFDWVYEEELELRRGFRWSPDGRWLAYWQLDCSEVRPFTMIRNTDGLYPTLVTFPYPKAGELNSAARVGVVAADGGETIWMDLPGDPREHYPAQVEWTRDGRELLIQQFNRLQNTNRVFLGDARTGRMRVVHTETDAAWLENENKVRWLGDGRHFLWLSERSGWRQIYLADRSNGSMRRLTEGDFDVIELLTVDETNRWVYFIASPENATQRHLYRVPLRGGKPSRVTPADQPGVHRYSISSDATLAVHTWSRFDTPPVTDLVRLPGHERVRWLAENKQLKEKLDTLARPASEFFQVTTADGVVLDGWCLKPPGLDPGRRYPVLFHVYGEPHGTTVVDQWGGSSLLWHWMLAQQGYLVMSVDNRGAAAPRGRAWRKCVHRQIGILTAADQAAAVRAIVKSRSYVDPKRIAIWGWSGGGTSSLNAIFQYPDLYQAAMAVAAVPNQRLYDTIYQERYMGLPGDNPEGYRLGSPITHAHKLRGHLLIVHGTGDDNVHYQGAEALVNELIAHNKRFTMMAYPNRTHNISEGPNTTRHLYQLLTDFLREHVPAGATP